MEVYPSRKPSGRKAHIITDPAEIRRIIANRPPVTVEQMTASVMAGVRMGRLKHFYLPPFCIDDLRHTFADPVPKFILDCSCISDPLLQSKYIRRSLSQLSPI